MDKISTPKITLPSSSTSRSKKNRPSQLTLAFLRQFARSYHVEPELIQAINNFVIN